MHTLKPPTPALLMLCLTWLVACSGSERIVTRVVTVVPDVPSELTDERPAPSLQADSIAAYGEWVANLDAQLVAANCDKAQIRAILDAAGKGEEPEARPC